MCKCNHIVIEKIPGKQRGFNYIVECPTCAKRFEIQGSHFNNSQRVYCSVKCRANAPVKPKRKPYKFRVGNGRLVASNGYILYRVSRGVYRAEHRYVMEQSLGRKLESWEVVHHINHDRTDNRLENLYLTTSSWNSQEAIQWNGLRPRDSATGQFLPD